MSHNRSRQRRSVRSSRSGRVAGKTTALRRRAEDLAFIKGRSRKRVQNTDFVEARQEIGGRERLAPKSTAAERLPEEDRWKPVPESRGRKIRPKMAQDEQTVTQHLVEEGVAEAEHDQMVRATRRAFRRDRQK
jgi:hypothetical protein